MLSHNEPMYSKYAYKQDENIRVKPASLETKTARRSEQKYVGRSNICQTCFTAKAVLTGECQCD